MKHLFVAALAVMVAFTSCVSKQVAVDAENQRDSMAMVVTSKDSLINAVFTDINAISENLALIKSRENLITVSNSAEAGRRPVEEINNDIAAIDRLLQENKAKIASLQYTASKLRKANLHIAALEKTIADLNSQLGDKRAEVEQLREKLAKMGVEVQNLTVEVAQQSAQVENLSGEKTQLENQLNTVYYIIGSEKELREAQIINKQGFIGRTLTVNKSGNIESFTKADSRLLSEIAIGHKKVTIVSAQPEGSYELVMDADKVVTKLVITDANRFWEASKILVISYK